MAEFVRLDAGGALQDRLFRLGVEFPCGGVSACGGCRVRLIDGDIPITDGMRDALTDEELAAGWRLACQGEATGPVTLDIEQWRAKILIDESRVGVEPAEGFGAVIDLGTTTLVVEIVHRATGDVVAVLAGLNPQGRHGSDVMSRIEFEIREPGVLTGLIRGALGAMLHQAAAGRALTEVLICGNTVMHHLFCAESVEPLSHVPFQSPALAERTFHGLDLGWPDVHRVTFLACAGGFVGSDLIAGLVACGLHESDRPTALLDLGTNGEIAVCHNHQILCASTAAGPAFEGGRIRMGMRAGDGAIDRVERDGSLARCHVIGATTPAGICGSGLVDAAAVWLDTGTLTASGRFANGEKSVPLASPVSLSQADIRELQLAKGAIAAGLDLLRRRIQLDTDALASIHLAGAFGNYVRTTSARRIGLLPSWNVPVLAAGNSAVRGTRALLLSPSRRNAILAALHQRLEHVELASDPEFQEAFVDNMLFPA